MGLSDFIRNVTIRKDGVFKQDRIQDRLLQDYLRGSPDFLKAFMTDFTDDFFQMVRDKDELKEPLSLCWIGATRSSKSYCGISVLAYKLALMNMEATIWNICADEFEYLEKLKKVDCATMLHIDESKLAVYNIGSVAKRMKLQDVQNIIAFNNISTNWLRPDEWATGFSQYGLKSFGRNFETKTSRFLVYNLQESSKGSVQPLGMVYIPIFTEFLTYGKELEIEYLKRKQEWVNQEQHSERDVLFKSRVQEAIKISEMPKFGELKKQKEKLVFVSIRLGSEFTGKEIEQITTIAAMLFEHKITAEELLKQ